MGKALILTDADFSTLAAKDSDIVGNKTYTTQELRDNAQAGFYDSGTGALRTDVSGYVHKNIIIDGYTSIEVSGTFPIHIGAFYNSKTIYDATTFVSCDGELTKTGVSYITRLVNVPSGAVSIGINLSNNAQDQTLKVEL